jgi:hypothetical protein
MLLPTHVCGLIFIIMIKLRGVLWRFIAVMIYTAIPVVIVMDEYSFEEHLGLAFLILLVWLLVSPDSFKGD